MLSIFLHQAIQETQFQNIKGEKDLILLKCFWYFCVQLFSFAITKPMNAVLKYEEKEKFQRTFPCSFEVPTDYYRWPEKLRRYAPTKKTWLKFIWALISINQRQPESIRINQHLMIPIALILLNLKGLRMNMLVSIASMGRNGLGGGSDRSDKHDRSGKSSIGETLVTLWREKTIYKCMHAHSLKNWPCLIGYILAHHHIERQQIYWPGRFGVIHSWSQQEILIPRVNGKFWYQVSTEIFDTKYKCVSKN